uniref:Solute carrier family 25 member 33 n=1 Tax=Varanus komodoensis TaxID=61221 RepID=A0A8D2IPA6_VARKO
MHGEPLKHHRGSCAFRHRLLSQGNSHGDGIRKLSGEAGAESAFLLFPSLPVVKTRLQSSSLALRPLCLPAVQLQGVNGALIRPGLPSVGALELTILEKEGVRSLFRGLGPNLIGVAPSRAIYFAAYAGAKEKLNMVLVPESKKVHMLSAACAGKLRIVCERSTSGLRCAMRIYYTEGLRGFYRGITASYAGISETIIHFVIYEALKKRLKEHRQFLPPALPFSPNSQDFCGLMAAAAISKMCASCIAYPHEVIRTRLREEGSRYRSFVQTLQLVAREEGPLALYRGLLAHLIRQIPNAAIVMVTYELTIHLATKM